MNYIELAQECQLIGMRPHLDGIYQEALERFAKLVAAQEREECAKVCESNVWRSWWLGSTKSEVGAESGFQCAAAIRARGEA